jgi:hypothetical protein
MQGITAVSPLNTESFPSSLILATPAGMFVGRLRELIQTLNAIPLTVNVQ